MWGGWIRIRSGAVDGGRGAWRGDTEGCGLGANSEAGSGVARVAAGGGGCGGEGDGSMGMGWGGARTKGVESSAGLSRSGWPRALNTSFTPDWMCSTGEALPSQLLAWGGEDA